MTSAETCPDLVAWAKTTELSQQQRRFEERVVKRGIWVPTAISATQLGLKCERAIAYQYVRPYDAAPISSELASIFAEGDFHEEQTLREFEQVTGAQVVSRQATFRDERLHLVGRLDGEITIELNGRSYTLPVDAKSCAALPGESIVDGDDLADSEKTLYQKYYAQMVVYLLLCSRENGLLVWKNKNTGAWRVVVVSLDFDRAEILLKKAQRVWASIETYLKESATRGVRTREPPPENQTEAQQKHRMTALSELEAMLPDRDPTRSECMRCPFMSTCNPAMAPVDPALIAVEEELVKQLDRRSETKADRDEYERIDKAVKQRIKLTAGTRFVVGRHYVEKKMTSNGACRITIESIG